MVDEKNMRQRAEAVAVHETGRDLETSLRRPDGRVALIAEVKRASPSKGELVKGEFKPASMAATYQDSGASAISVLTDERYFRGSLHDLEDVRKVVQVPVLRKDFIVDPYQVYEARAAGADAVLLIVAALDDAQLRDLYALATEQTLTPLVEVHDEREAERAVRLGARVIGVNNRDLHSFVTDLRTTERCARCINSSVEDHVLVSESGIFTPQDVGRVAVMGACAVLVGESIITSGSIAEQVKTLSNVMRAKPSTEE